MEDQRALFRVVIDTVEDKIAANDFDGLGKLLDDFVFEEGHTFLPIVYLRSSFRVRHKVEAWQAFLARTWKHLEGTGVDVERKLKGLCSD